ncbi:MAG: SDR family NAD(P)-dependent oxidoreductase [Gammaproteobacteria bacterium]
MQLKDSIAVVTGAAHGIGRATAIRLAAEGASIAILDLDADALAGTAADVQAAGAPRTLPLVLDLTAREAIAAAFARIRAELGPVDVLVNNVGRSLRDKAAPFGSLPPQSWDDMLDVCLRPTLACTHQVYNDMRDRRSGRIVNIASDSAIVGPRANAPYAAAKGGVVGFTRALARELAPFAVNVNAIAPGYIRTRAMDTIPKELIEKAIAETPLGFMGAPEDIANAVCFLATDQSRYITGQTLIVNGGRWFN